MRLSSFFMALPAVFGLVFCALLTINAQDPSAQKDKGTGSDAQKDKGTGDQKGDRTFQGRIAKVDADKKTITLSDVRTGSGGTGTGGTGTDRDKGTGTDKDKGTGTDKDKGTGTQKDKGTGSDAQKDKGTGSDTGKSQQMMFTLADNTKVTLDGKEARLADLKEGYTARVTVGSQGSGTGTGSDKGTGTDRDKNTGSDKGTGTDKDKSTTGQGANMRATRIEAFSKNP